MQCLFCCCFAVNRGEALATIFLPFSCQRIFSFSLKYLNFYHPSWSQEINKDTDGITKVTMVDLINNKEQTNGEQIRKIMDKTQGILKSSMLTFLGNSSDIINEISNKLESALSLSDSSSYSTETVPSCGSLPTPQDAPSGPLYAVKKLHTLPTFGMTFEDREALAKHKRKIDNTKCSTSRQSREQSDDSFSSSPGLRCDNNGVGDESVKCEGSSGDIDRELSSLHLSHSMDSNMECSLVATGPDPYDKLKVDAEVPSSGSASDLDGYGPSTSIDSSNKDGKNFWVRSGSEGSVQSWASSLSLDSQSDEATVEFMRHFVSQLFKDCSTITLDQKAKFGELCQNETGRLWFSRFVNAQRGRSKCVSEATFYSLIQYFAIVLFECADADDFSPAKSLMNMCFTFYFEVEVPGCEPYKEYLYMFLKEQPIWHSVRFWNAAFFDALQCERIHRPIATKDDIASSNTEALYDDKQYQENITFGQLGTFTYNMHAFGLTKDLCSEFLRKQCTIANLSQEQEKMLRDNVERMYKETDPWRA